MWTRQGWSSIITFSHMITIIIILSIHIIAITTIIILSIHIIIIILISSSPSVKDLLSDGSILMLFFSKYKSIKQTK